MTIYAHAPEHHIQNQTEPEATTTSGAETTEEKIAPAESAESSTPLCEPFGEESSQGATGGSSEYTSCPATLSATTNSAKVSLPVGESLFGLVIVTPFLLHFLKRKIS